MGINKRQVVMCRRLHASYDDELRPGIHLLCYPFYLFTLGDLVGMQICTASQSTLSALGGHSRPW